MVNNTVRLKREENFVLNFVFGAFRAAIAFNEECVANTSFRA
jgi:hypothetical protein